MDLSLVGKRALVTGGSSGLGLGCAQALAAEGAIVTMVGRSQERLDAAAATIRELVHTQTGDLSRVEDVAAMVAQAEETMGGIDILIANAGGPPAGTFASITMAQYEEAIRMNLLATVAMCQASVPGMQSRGWGRVIAITSTSVREPIGNLILSNTARAGLTGFLKTLATEVAVDGVTVNSLQPGSHNTDRLAKLYGGDLSAVAKSTPTGTLGDAGDFGRIAAFLCSDSAKFVTGAAIPVDGGATRNLQ
ncbi:MAG: SDR family oxidoreductase [Ilumatobacteraceae bacterium]